MTSFVGGKHISINPQIILSASGVHDYDAYHYCSPHLDNSFPTTYDCAVSTICSNLNELDESRPSYVALGPKWT